MLGWVWGEGGEEGESVGWGWGLHGECGWVGGGSDPPQQEVVGAVVAPHALAAVGQAEILVAIATADDQHFGFGHCQAGLSRVALLRIVRLFGA